MSYATDIIRAELLKRLTYMENSWDDSRVTEYVTQRERSIAILTISRMRQHIEQAFRGEILEGKPIVR